MKKQIEFVCPHCKVKNNIEIEFPTLYLFTTFVNCKECKKSVYLAIKTSVEVYPEKG